MDSKRLMILILIIISLFFVAKFAMQDSGKSGSDGGPVAQKQPGPYSEGSSDKAAEFSMNSISGGKIKLSDYAGKVIILDFWATWCPPCKAEIPFFIELYKQYKKDGLVIIGAALDEKSKVVSFVKKNGVNYPVGLGDQKLGQLYGGIRGIPTTFVIDRKGNIVSKYVGFRPKQVFEQDFLDLK